MKTTERLRKCWHDVYYFLTFEPGAKFALTCKEATEQVDLRTSTSKLKRLQYFLHMSLCQACKNYLSTSNALRKAVKSIFEKKQNVQQLDRLNAILLKKHSRAENRNPQN